MNTKTNTILRYINVGLCCLLAILFILPVMKLDIVQPNGEYLIHFSIGQFFGFAQLIEDFMKSYNATQSLNDQSLILFANAAKELYMLILFLILPLVGILLSLLPRTIKVSWLTGVVALICLVCFSVFYHQIDSNISAFNAQMSGFYSMNSYQRSGYSYMFSMAPYGYLYVLLCLASVVVSIVLFIKREKPVAVQVLVDPTTGRVDAGHGSRDNASNTRSPYGSNHNHRTTANGANGSSNAGLDSCTTANRGPNANPKS